MSDFDYFIGPYPELSSATTGEFNKSIWKRREFHTVDGQGLASHQRRVQRYASPVTPYDEILLFHAMGTGKTRSALAIAENALVDSRIDQVFVVGKTSRNVRLIFSEELKKMTLARLGKQKLDEDEERNLKKHISTYYKFMSYGTMGSMNAENRYAIGGRSAASLKKMFNNSVFILDEVHNLSAAIGTGVANTTKDLMYKRFKMLFSHKITPNRKIVLLSGTPMINSPRDIVPLLNLILPPHDQVNWTDVDKLKSDVARVAKGRVSYLKENTRGDVPNAIMEGVRIDPLSTFKLVYLAMSAFQSAAYEKIVNSEDVNEAAEGFGLELQRAALFAFPSGNAQDWTSSRNELNPEFWKKMSTGNVIDMDKVCTHSCKFASALRAIREGPWPIYVYSNIVEGSRYRENNRWINTVTGAGLKLFSLFLQKMGYSRFTKKSGGAGRRYLYFTSDDRPSREALALLNKEGENSDGRLCRVILGSAASSEGYTFRNVKKEIVLTPHHHYSQIAQALARGVRVGAHDQGSTGSGTVVISRLVAVPKSQKPCGTELTAYSGKADDIVDVVMYNRSEKKDIAIKKIENVIKTKAFDCAFNFEQNKRFNFADGSRECDYGECEYSCEGVSEFKTNAGSYTIRIDQMVNYTFEKYYPPGLKRKIKRFFQKTNRSATNFDEIKRKVGRTIPDALLEALGDMIENREIVSYRNGRPCYLWNDGDQIGLTYSVVEPTGTAARASSFYVDNQTVKTSTTNKEWIDRERQSSVGEKLDVYFDKPDLFLHKPNVACNNCPNVSTLPMAVQEKLLETSVLFVLNYAQTPLQNTQKFSVAQRLKLYYDMALFVVDGKLVSALEYTFGKGSLRVVENGVWVDADDAVTNKYLNTYGGSTTVRASKKKALDERDESYGLYNYATCDFCVVLNGKKRVVKKKAIGARGLRPGRSVCSFPHPQLASIFLQEGVTIDPSIVPPPYFPWICALVPPRFSASSLGTSPKPKTVKKIKMERLKFVEPREWDETKLEEQIAQLSFRKNSELASILLLDFKKRDKVFLDTNCGTADKNRLAVAAKK
tara:strand:- start:2070 stop:5237 length:3168 start_codon:yes stop_codon:yes gene_type:complete